MGQLWTHEEYPYVNVMEEEYQKELAVRQAREDEHHQEWLDALRNPELMKKYLEDYSSL